MISFRVIAQDRKSFKKKELKIFINVSILYKKYIYSVAASPHRGAYVKTTQHLRGQVSYLI